MISSMRVIREVWLRLYARVVGIDGQWMIIKAGEKECPMGPDLLAMNSDLNRNFSIGVHINVLND